MGETLQANNKSIKEEYFDLRRPKRQPGVKEQLSEKLQLLLTSAEGDTISQVAKETGLSKNLVLSWQEGWADQPSDSSTGLNNNGQPEELLIANPRSNLLANPLLAQQQISDDNLEVEQQANFHQGVQETVQQSSSGARQEYKSQMRVSGLPENR